MKGRGISNIHNLQLCGAAFEARAYGMKMKVYSVVGRN